MIQTSASIYLSIGNALPTPAPQTIEELRVNASMYDAQQGSTSGAHIDLSTASGTNEFHGSRLCASRERTGSMLHPSFSRTTPAFPRT